MKSLGTIVEIQTMSRNKLSSLITFHTFQEYILKKNKKETYDALNLQLFEKVADITGSD
jgi:hypothetical protein